MEKLEIHLIQGRTGILQQDFDAGPLPELRPYVGLKELHLGALLLDDLSFLEKYTQLCYLKLDGVYLDIFELVAPLPLLKELELANSKQLRKITSLSHCPNLEVLKLARLFSLKKLPSLQRLTKLREVDCTQLPKLTEVPSLSNMRQLRKVSLKNLERLEALPDLSGCLELEELDVVGSKCLSDINGISNCPSLQRVSILIASYRIADRPKKKQVPVLATFRACPAIRKLSLHRCASLYNYSSLSTLTSLRELGVTERKLETSLDLNACLWLEKLVLKLKAPLPNKDLSFLSRCVNLLCLELVGNSFAGSLRGLSKRSPLLMFTLADAKQVTNLSALATYSDLVALSLRNSSLVSLTELSNFPNLCLLDLFNSRKLTTISGIEGCTKLEKLVLRGAKVRDLTPVLACSKLSILLLPSTSNVEAITSLKKLASKLHLIDKDGNEEGEDDEEEEDEESEESEEGEEEEG